LVVVVVVGGGGGGIRLGCCCCWWWWWPGTKAQTQSPINMAACDGESIDRTCGPDTDFHVDTGVDPHRSAIWKVYVRKRKRGAGKN